MAVGMVAHSCNLSTQEARGSQVPSQLGKMLSSVDKQYVYMYLFTY